MDSSKLLVKTDHRHILSRMPDKKLKQRVFQHVKVIEIITEAIQRSRAGLINASEPLLLGIFSHGDAATTNDGES
jgi:ATP-dependent Clp protease ATP-binding subunit ClpA